MNMCMTMSLVLFLPFFSRSAFGLGMPQKRGVFFKVLIRMPFIPIAESIE